MTHQLNPDGQLTYPATPHEALEVVQALKTIITTKKDSQASKGAAYSVHRALLDIAEGEPLSEAAKQRGVTPYSLAYTIGTRSLVPMRYAILAGRLKRAKMRVAYAAMGNDDVASDIKKSLKIFITYMGKASPSARAYDNWRKSNKQGSQAPSAQTVIRFFGTWNKALESIGVKNANRKGQYDPEMVLAHIAHWILTTPSPHTTSTLRPYAAQYEDMPSAGSISRYLPGTFRESIAAIENELLGKKSGDARITKAVKVAKKMARS